MRYRRDIAGIINGDFLRALTNVLRPIMGPPMPFDPISVMSSEKSRDKISRLLNKADLDMTAVEAEAVRQNLANVEKLDRLLAAAEDRRDKAFRSLAWCRKSFTKKLRQSSDSVLAANTAPSITPAQAN